MATPLVPSEPEAQPRASTSNRRASVRYQCGLATAGRVSVAEKHEFLRAWVLDLSAHGMGLLISRALEVGQLVVITVKSTSGDHTYELPARVARVTAHPHGDWVVGFELNQLLSPDDLDALL
jgi:hypothetical protein